MLDINGKIGLTAEIRRIAAGFTLIVQLPSDGNADKMTMYLGVADVRS